MFCLGQKLKLQSFQLRLVWDIVIDFLIDVEKFESLFKECAKLHASCAFVTYVPIIYVLKCLTCLRVLLSLRALRWLYPQKEIYTLFHSFLQCVWLKYNCPIMFSFPESLVYLLSKNVKIKQKSPKNFGTLP